MLLKEKEKCKIKQKQCHRKPQKILEILQKTKTNFEFFQKQTLKSHKSKSNRSKSSKSQKSQKQMFAYLGFTNQRKGD